ncbi:MAG: 16S rRNA (guanine(966)-N(2))-methyltransferase RsmD [Bryobacteraceae bacterium]
MRVIGGEFRSRRLKSLPGLETRPTPDRLRETLFNVLAPQLADCVFLDVYAGTGAVGIEALSRGARRSVFIEKNRRAVEVIRENLATMGLESRAEVFTGQAARVLERARADIAFLDPPYEMSKEYETAMAALDRSETPLAIVQHSSRAKLEDAYGSLKRYRIIRQGDNCLSLYAK